jgi:hypothetical protein
MYDLRHNSRLGLRRRHCRLDAGDGRGQLRRVGWVARLHRVVDDDTVVVDDLGLVAAGNKGLRGRAKERLIRKGLSFCAGRHSRHTGAGAAVEPQLPYGLGVSARRKG